MIPKIEHIYFWQENKRTDITLNSTIKLFKSVTKIAYNVQLIKSMLRKSFKNAWLIYTREDPR